MNVYALGASRNIGYDAALRLLAKGAHVTFLLRSPSVFDSDAAIQRFVTSGHVQIVQGDALNSEDVAKGWESAVQGGPVDLVLFTVGSIPKFHLTSGFKLDPVNLCTRALLNVLVTLPQSLRAPESQPEFVAISSLGLTQSSRKVLPLIYRPLYSVLLSSAHEDKLGMEYVLAYLSGRKWEGDEPSSEILPPGWKDDSRLLGPKELMKVVVLRPALYIGEECRGDKVTKESGKEPYRVSDGNLQTPYSISRPDVAHFIVERLLPEWQRWQGTCVDLAY
ncbi:hypothetical protein K474DRAFT_1661445 [Panus rudis PR-1116 ss-1]|nr:hypothetical protein K474DRAFT_1661445 [Panus rudis PR-1116 ss-1]